MAAKDLGPTGEDDTDLDFYGTPTGNIWRPDTAVRRAGQAAEQLHRRTGPSRAISQPTPERILARRRRTD